MARLFTSGFEWNDLTSATPDLTAVGPATITSGTVRSGGFAGQCAGSSGTTPNFGTPSVAIPVSGSVFGRCFFNFNSLPVSSPAILYFAAAAAHVRVNGTGTLSLIDGGSSLPIGATSSEINTGTWYRVELKHIVNGSGQITDAEFLLDGAGIASGSLSTPFPLSSSSMRCGFPNSNPGTTCTVFVDDLAINDSTGGSQNGYPGDGKVVLLAAASDNAKGTGWTNDAAGASNFFDAVNNEPPVGIADTTAGSGLHQIRNATSNANVNYDANLTTYTAAGIGASDTVNVLVPQVATAAPVTTSSKQGTVGVSSNPAITNVALGAGGTAGAFWSGVAGGTYPTGWKWSTGTTTYAPSVTLGSAPVMRITQVTSSTRIAMVCAMGMYVDYTPAVVAPPELGLGLSVT